MIELIYENYPRVIMTSKARRFKYYIKGKNEPKAKKYQDVTKYKYKLFKNGKYYLVDLNDKLVIANPKAANTPKYITISGQDIWSMNMHPAMRAKIASELHIFFKKEINKIKNIDFYPLEIKVEIHDTIKYKKSYWDVDNRALIYNKTFMDTLTECGKIKDDCNIYVTAPPAPIFIPINEGETSKLVYIIKKCEDDRILSFFKKNNILTKF
jgi:hypothetical protein